MSKTPKSIFLMHYSPTNTGAVAMAESVIISLKNKYPETKIIIESDYPELTKKMFDDVEIVKRAFFIADITLTKKILSFEFFVRNIKFIIRTICIFFIGFITGIFKLKKTPIDGLNAMINSDLILSLAGDSISQYYTYQLRFFEFWLINRYKIPNILYAQSVGPFDGLARKQARIGLKFVTAIIARDQKTIELMKEYNINIPIYRSVDSAIMLPTIKNKKNEHLIKKYDFSKKKTVGIVIRPNKLTEYSEDDYLQYTKGINKVIDYIIKNKINVVFIPTIEEDYNTIRRFFKKFNLEFPIIKLFNFKASEAKGILENLYFVISPRMHPVILSSSSDGCVPVIGLGREFKMIEYLKLIKQEDYFMDYLPFDENLLIKKINKMKENRDENNMIIQKEMVKLKKLSADNINIVDKIYSNYVK